MRLYYFTASPNFGDSLNSWLWQRLLPGRWEDDGICFCGIGTILNAEMPPASRWIVFTSGVGYGGRPTHFADDDWQVISVRGPLSAAILGLPRDAAVTDGALLLATLPEMSPLPERERRGTVFIPHFEAAKDAAWPEACRRAGIEYLDPLADSRIVTNRIRHARLVVAEAMHGAIVADALRVPFVPVASSPLISSFKWLDWTLSMDLPYRPFPIRASSVRSALRNRMLWAYGQTHSFADRNAKAALTYYRQRYECRRSSARSHIDSIGRRVHRRLERLLDRPPFAAWQTRGNEAALDRAATDLARAAATDGILSDNRVHAQRLAALAQRLEHLR